MPGIVRVASALGRGATLGPIPDFHEARFKIAAWTPRAARPTLAQRWTTSHPHIPYWSTAMTWTTPAAADFRFGFEITMYIAAR
jgi:coenzyme PQQ precursor peptide PqqA